MTPQELALHSWREEKVNYEKSARRVITDLCDSLQVLPSPTFDSKLEELREYLRYNYTYDEQENFLEVYVQFIAGRKNISVMELSNKLMEQIGGNIKFWQTKITDIAVYVHYHPELSMWEVNSFYERYIGLPPETMNNLRRKKVLAKKYLSYITSICKLIDKSKSFEEDLLKIDEAYIKLKRAEEEYYAYVEEVESKINQHSNISSKGIITAKRNLFLFLKPKESKTNTLMNYNFKCKKPNQLQSSKLMKGAEYEEFDQIINKLKNHRKSQRINVSSKHSKKEEFPSVNSLREQFKASHKQVKQTSVPFQPHPIFVWSKEYFFSFWGHIIKSGCSFNYAAPFQIYPNINYEIDSQEQFDEFLAEDVDLNESDQSLSIDENQNSFVVSDYHESDQEEESRMKALTQNYFQDRWVKTSSELKGYEIIGFDSLPLPLTEGVFCEELIDKVSGLSRIQIISLLDEQNHSYSKAKLDDFLRTKFKKKRSKNKIIYLKLGEESKEGRQDSSQNQSTAQIYEISISYVENAKISEILENDETILQESESKSNHLSL